MLLLLLLSTATRAQQWKQDPDLHNGKVVYGTSSLGGPTFCFKVVIGDKVFVSGIWRRHYSDCGNQFFEVEHYIGGYGGTTDLEQNLQEAFVATCNGKVDSRGAVVRDLVRRRLLAQQEEDGTLHIALHGEQQRGEPVNLLRPE